MFAENSEKARQIAQKRCSEEREYDEACYWKVDEVKEIQQDTKIIALVKDVTWLLLKE